jgi:hypothetical protein
MSLHSLKHLGSPFFRLHNQRLCSGKILRASVEVSFSQLIVVGFSLLFVVLPPIRMTVALSTRRFSGETTAPPRWINGSATTS